MIIWRGYGFLIAIFAIVALVLAIAGAEGVWGKPLPADKRQLAELLGMLAAALATYGLHFALNRSSKPRVVVDKETGKEITLVARHDLFFIPVKFWPFVFGGLGVLFFFQR